jgi:hypothetical protein
MYKLMSRHQNAGQNNNIKIVYIKGKGKVFPSTGLGGP